LMMMRNCTTTTTTISSPPSPTGTISVPNSCPASPRSGLRYCLVVHSTWLNNSTFFSIKFFYQVCQISSTFDICQWVTMKMRKTNLNSPYCSEN
jgi:hypothetical protein